ncbi:MAG: filamentous hemagglutinin N-terminal domain-containing protein [Symploca sp. SIO3C6]|nr:filamentous hemagglutinin N-terminal domain-containing protein [Symploca sp. SIO3C6]
MVLKLNNSLRVSGAIPLIACLAYAGWFNRAEAQITPDNTLGNESSVVTPNVDLKGALADLIEGGAIRDINLFHSFLEFNVSDGGRVYFANPVGIESIFTRVTGNNVSNILGTLGVDGAANLFLLNPNGIVFGNNAQLDVEGSFFGTTANSLVFGDASEFSATNPNQPPLLKVSTPLGLQYGANSTSAIANSGNLAVGQDLTIAGVNLDLQGQLYAGGDLKLQAEDILKIRDNLYNPFIAAAGGGLEVEGNQVVDIFALNHPDSGLFAGGNLVLRSANSISGDAHYWSGGSFRIEKLDGSLGSLFSPNDPIVRSLGDVELLEYTGSSLHILAGGSVSIPGTVEITQADETGNTINPTDTPSLAQVTLSNGSALVIDGTAQPTLDIRAGMNQQAIGNPLNLTGGNFESVEESINTIPESADINVGQISLKSPEGLVLLTNQYQPNQSLLGGAIEVETIGVDDTFGEFTGNSGSVIIDSRAQITITNRIDASSDSGLGRGGEIKLLADGDISLINGAFVDASGNGGGGIEILGDRVSLSDGSRIFSITTGSESGREVLVNAKQLMITDGAVVGAGTLGEGSGGNLTVNATESVQVIGRSADSQLSSRLLARTNGRGDAGNLTISTPRLLIADGAVVEASTFGEGSGGSVTVNATESVQVIGRSADGEFPSRLLANTEDKGSGGNLNISTPRLLIADGAQVSANTFGEGAGGSVSVNASELVEVIDRSADGKFPSQLLASTEGQGNGGNIIIRTPTLLIADGASINAGTLDSGDGGSITVKASESVQVIGTSSDGEVSSALGTQAQGRVDAGNITISTPTLLIADGASINAGTLDSGDGGSITVKASESVQVIGTSVDGELTSNLRTNTQGSGNAGNLTISTPTLLLADGAQVSAGSLGSGDGGSLSVNASESVHVIGSSTNSKFRSNLSIQVEGKGNGGNLTISTPTLLIADGARVSASTLGSGAGGILTINTTESVHVVGTSADSKFNSRLTADTQGVGDAGNLTISTPVLRITDGALVSTGTSDSGAGGILTINATELVHVMGISADGESPSLLAAQANPGSTGKAGNLSISTLALRITDGAQVNAGTFTEGAGGNLTVNATESVQVIGSSADVRIPSVLSVRTQGKGNAGNLTISTPVLRITDGAQVNAGTFTEGAGGILSINVTESVQLSGTTVDGKFASALSARTQGKGNAGNLTISTPAFLITDGAEVSTSSLAEGAGGILTVDATESVQVIGTSANGEIASILNTQAQGEGNAGNLTIKTPRLLIADGAQVLAGTFGEGVGGILTVDATELVEVIGRSADGGLASVLSARTEGKGNAGNLNISTPALLIAEGAQVGTGTFGEGDGGSVIVDASESVQLIGESSDSQFPSALATQSQGRGDAGDLTINTQQLLVAEGGFISAASTREGKGGNLFINASEKVQVTGATADGEFSSTIRTISIEEGAAGNLTLNTKELLITDGAEISARSEGIDPAGNMTLNIEGLLSATDGDITTNASQSAGGAINITAQNIQLFGDSDIRTNVLNGNNNGGDINITADSVIAFDDSDILAFARDGAGGDVTFNTVAFFGENYRPAPKGTNPVTLDDNNRVDINASGGTDGVITLPDVSFIQNSIADLQEALVSPDSLIAGSCIIPTNQQQGSLYITGAGALPTRPGDMAVAPYPTGIVKPIGNSGDSPNSVSRTNRRWQKGDPIIEPTGVYQLPNGKLVMGRECSR